MCSFFLNLSLSLSLSLVLFEVCVCVCVILVVVMASWAISVGEIKPSPLKKFFYLVGCFLFPLFGIVYYNYQVGINI